MQFFAKKKITITKVMYFIFRAPPCTQAPHTSYIINLYIYGILNMVLKKCFSLTSKFFF